MDPHVGLKIVELVSKLVLDFTKLHHRPEDHPPISIDRTDYEVSIIRHLDFVRNWCDVVYIDGMHSARHLDSVYVRLTVARSRYVAGPTSSFDTTIDVAGLLDSGQHTIVLGNLGTGKTTTIQHLAHLLLTTSATDGRDTLAFPIVLQFRQFSNTSSILSELLRAVGITFSVAPTKDKRTAADRQRQLETLQQNLLVDILNSTDILVLLDGLDEAPANLHKAILDDLESLARRVERSTIILTCRPGVIPGPIQGFSLATLLPLDNRHVAAFATRWFGDADRAQAFLDRLSTKTYADIANTPLHLANLCLIDDRGQALPDEAVRVYEKILQIRLIEWDRSRRVSRATRYGAFGPDEKRRFLAAMAYVLSADGPALVVSSLELKKAYSTICAAFSLPPEDVDGVVKEIESHTGILVHTGYDRFEFIHKSLQEFLLGEHLSRLSDLDELAHRMFAIPDGMAVATMLSSSPGYLFGFVVGRATIVGGKTQQVRARGQGIDRLKFLYSYLGRLVHERYKLPADINTGDGLLWCLAASEDRRLDQASIDSTVRALCDSDWGEEAMRLALSRYDIKETSDGIHMNRKAKPDAIIGVSAPKTMAFSADCADLIPWPASKRALAREAQDRLKTGDETSESPRERLESSYFKLPSDYYYNVFHDEMFRLLGRESAERKPRRHFKRKRKKGS